MCYDDSGDSVACKYRCGSNVHGVRLRGVVVLKETGICVTAESHEENRTIKPTSMINTGLQPSFRKTEY